MVCYGTLNMSESHTPTAKGDKIIDATTKVSSPNFL